MNKHGVSRRRFAEDDVKYFNRGALRTGLMCISKILLIDTERFSKTNFLQVFFKDFVNRFENNYLKMHFFGVIFENFVDRFQNSYQSKSWIV